jgi:hypothetical protein
MMAVKLASVASGVFGNQDPQWDPMHRPIIG